MAVIGQKYTDLKLKKNNVAKSLATLTHSVASIGPAKRQRVIEPLALFQWIFVLPRSEPELRKYFA